MLNFRQVMLGYHTGQTQENVDFTVGIDIKPIFACLSLYFLCNLLFFGVNPQCADTPNSIVGAKTSHEHCQYNMIF